MKISVRNFSCIDTADLEFGKITLLIGPQASGKSVLSKLAYFCLDSFTMDPSRTQGNWSFDAYKETTRKRFYDWFPLSAWGDNQFVIEFSIGNFQLKLSRTIYKNKATDNFRIITSDQVRTHFDELDRFARALDEKAKESEEIRFERVWQMYEASSKSLEKHLGQDDISRQLFVPAGRSFFTSVGKAVTAFEQGRVLDPLILRFGRLYAEMREPGAFFGESKYREEVTENFSKIFGGRIIDEGGEELVLTDDGRKIPFAALSSGQQELLPLITVLPFMSTSDARNKMLVYIEEPEAHLFPKSQSQLVEMLTSMTNRRRAPLHMLLTTHSPYVPAKFNNLIKAGQLTRRLRSKVKKDKLDKIVPIQNRIQDKTLRAYGIVNGSLKDLMDENGLIDADYLDSVSGDISEEFSELLSVEYDL